MVKSAFRFICMHARPTDRRRGRDLPPPFSAQALRAPREKVDTMYQGHTLVVSARCSRPMGDGRADHICGPAQAAAPPIVGDGHDLLLELTLRESGCGLASLPEGSSAGLRRLTRGEVMIAAIHLHGLESDDAQANVSAVADAPGLHDAVLISFARR